jgi:16S rRNA C1402 N4-methylase RsmH
MNALLFERSVWFATGPLILEEEAQQMEDFIYHRPVLAEEVVELLALKPRSLVVDGTCGGGGHTEALLRTGADVLALDQDPDAVRHVTEQLAQFGRHIAVRHTNFRHACTKF